MLPETTPHNPTETVITPATPKTVGCVMVVRSDDLRERIGAALAVAGSAATVDSAPSYLSAMGRLVAAKPAAIIGPVSAMTGMVASTARALRKLAPGARLVIVAQPHERDEAIAALDAGFDECVYEPAPATELLAALGSAVQPALPARPATPDAHTENHEAPADSESTHDAAEDSARPESIPEPLADAPPHADTISQDKPSAQAPLGEVDTTTALGDVDLVDSLLQDGGELPKQAQRLLTQQSGIPGIALAQSAAEVPPGHTVVAVRCNSQQLGLLHAPNSTTPQALEPWADWLARWLALDKHVADLQRQAMTDELTGIWNRRYFQRFLKTRLDDAARERQQVTLLLFDIDNFKQYNDNYGHPAGDAILQETARLIQSLVRDHDVVARIGGDEFAVVFWDKGEPRHLGSQHPDNVLGIARRFQKAIGEHKFPKLGIEAEGTLTVSAGLAGFPWDGRTPEELIAQADAMAIQSKRNGKNAVCFGPGCAPFSNGNSNDESSTDAPNG